VQRVLKGVDCAALEAAVARRAQQALAAAPAPGVPSPFEAMAIGGKTLRASSKGGATHAHLLSALSRRLGVVLGQIAAPDKANEVTAVDDLLRALVLDGWVVTTDAMFTQRAVARSVRDAGGDYLMAVKEHQPTLLDDLMALFADPVARREMVQETRLHGGRIERRTPYTSTELVGFSDWPGLAQALCVERRVTEKATGETRCETAYAVTSSTPAAASPATLLALWREHWHGENKLHWVRDVAFGADRSTVRAGTIPQALAAVRNAAIGVHRALGATNIAAACRRYAAQPALALAALGLRWENA
jgi:predicted transposase YbfD/YdcC